MRQFSTGTITWYRVTRGCQLFRALGARVQLTLLLASGQNCLGIVGTHRKENFANISSEILSLYTGIAANPNAVAPDRSWWNSSRSIFSSVQKQRQLPGLRAKPARGMVPPGGRDSFCRGRKVNPIWKGHFDRASDLAVGNHQPKWNIITICPRVH